MCKNYKFKKIISILLSILFLFTLLLNKYINSKTITNHVNQKELIFFDTNQGNSFDPLDGDITSNLFIMRTLYATPLEVTPNNILTSSVLESFHYDQKNNQMQWVVKAGLKYSDNSEIKTNDVLLSILRMALKRPKYPVIKNIIGIDEWSKKPNALKMLPEGIYVEENKIIIKFNKNLQNPFFRFALEIFSIVPSHCIDLSTNKLNCKIPPQSGYYKLDNLEKNEINFTLRKNPKPFHGYTAPTKLKFKYITPADIKSNDFILSKNALLFGNEFRLKSENITKLYDNLKFKYLPSALFRFFLINPNIPPFDNSECRLLFSDTLRKITKEIMGKDHRVSGSLFPSILPGYLNESELGQITQSIDKSNCIKYMQSHQFPWVKIKSNNLSFEDKLLSETFKSLDLKDIKISEVESTQARDKKYLENKNTFLSAGSGFWAQDPLGDLQMFFSPGMHPLLRDTIGNTKINLQLEKINNTNETDLKENFIKLNQIIYTESVLSVFMHTRRFYAGNSIDDIRDLPQAMVAPAPWQVFNIRD